MRKKFTIIVEVTIGRSKRVQMKNWSRIILFLGSILSSKDTREIFTMVYAYLLRFLPIKMNLGHLGRCLRSIFLQTSRYTVKR